MTNKTIYTLILCCIIAIIAITSIAITLGNRANEHEAKVREAHKKVHHLIIDLLDEHSKKLNELQAEINKLKGIQ